MPWPGRAAWAMHVPLKQAGPLAETTPPVMARAGLPAVLAEQCQ